MAEASNPPPYEYEVTPGSPADDLVNRYALAKEASRRATAELKELSDAMLARALPVDAGAAGAAEILLRASTATVRARWVPDSWAVDTARMKREAPALYVSWLKDKPTRGYWRLDVTS